MYRSFWILMMCVGTLLVSTSGTLLARHCSNECSITNQVLTCSHLDYDDFIKLSQCIRKHHGSLVVNIRNTKLACSCRFLEFVKMLHQTPRKIIFYDTVCSSKLIVQCGASKGVETDSENPIFSLIGGKVFDITAPDFESKLTNMDKQQSNIIDRLHMTYTRKLYNIAQEKVIEKALFDADCHSGRASENKFTDSPGNDEDDDNDENYEDVKDDKDDKDDKIVGESPDDYQYSTMETLFFVFLIIHVILFAILIVVLLHYDLSKSSQQEEEKDVSNNAIDSDLTETQMNNVDIDHLEQ